MRAVCFAVRVRDVDYYVYFQAQTAFVLHDVLAGDQPGHALAAANLAFEQ